MVFQSYALYPHMTVYRNMAFGLKFAAGARPRSTPRCAGRRDPASDAAARPQAPRALRRPAPAGRHRPGHRARAQVFLFDEPLSNLDAALRVNTRIEIAKLHRQLPPP